MKTGRFKGAKLPFIIEFDGPLTETDTGMRVLKAAAAGTLIQNWLKDRGIPIDASDKIDLMAEELSDLSNAFTIGSENKIETADGPIGCTEGNSVYEARVLKGIWAAAPYLHNGSVPTLRDLLKKPEIPPGTSEEDKEKYYRPESFQVGVNYDLGDVGLSKTQPPGSSTYVTTGCEEGDSGINSGNSRCGHTYGVGLSEPEKDALVEYLKTL